MLPLKERIAEREARRAEQESDAEVSRQAVASIQSQVLADLERQGDEEVAQRTVELQHTRKRVAGQSAANKPKPMNPFAKKVADDVATKAAAKKKK